MPDPHPSADLDALIRGRLDHAAEQIDPRPLFDRIMGAQRTPRLSPPGSPKRGRGRYLVGFGLGLATAAGIAVAVGAVLFAPPAPVAAAPTPEEIVRDARAAHQQPLDRCYLVEFRQETDALAESAPVIQTRTTRLWTRGDRFWIESTGRIATWAWGRDEQNGIWIVLPDFRKGPDGRPVPLPARPLVDPLRKLPEPRLVGLKLDPDETPRWLDQACEMFSMRLETLLGEVLRDFDLTRESGPAESPNTVTIHAALKPGHWNPGLRSARLEIDASTKTIRKLVLNRVRNGQPLATVTYTLVETRPQDDGKYQLEGHLPPGAEVYTRDHEPTRRAALLRLWFGVSGIGPRPPMDAKK